MNTTPDTTGRERFPRLRILIPARGASTRIKDKNLQEIIPGKSLLAWTIELYQRYLPGVPIHVATESHPISRQAVALGCHLHGRIFEDIVDTRDGFGILRDFTECYPGAEVLLVECTSPFTYRSELERALASPLPWQRAAYCGPLHLPGDGTTRSQHLPPRHLLTGNFYLQRTPYPNLDVWSAPEFACPVSWTSAIDINWPEDLETARLLAPVLTHDHLDNRYNLGDFKN